MVIFLQSNFSGLLKLFPPLLLLPPPLSMCCFLSLLTHIFCVPSSSAHALLLCLFLPFSLSLVPLSSVCFSSLSVTTPVSLLTLFLLLYLIFILIKCFVPQCFFHTHTTTPSPTGTLYHHHLSSVLYLQLHLHLLPCFHILLPCTAPCRKSCALFFSSTN